MSVSVSNWTKHAYSLDCHYPIHLILHYQHHHVHPHCLFRPLPHPFFLVLRQLRHPRGVKIMRLPTFVQQTLHDIFYLFCFPYVHWLCPLCLRSIVSVLYRLLALSLSFGA